MKNILYNAAAIIFFSSPVFAENLTNQINVIGLIPGISTPAQVNAAADNGITNSGLGSLDKSLDTLNSGMFTIGGIKMNCAVSFDKNKMELFSCVTGMFASNVETHNILKRGFQEKFGTPYIDKDSVIRNKLGVEYNTNSVSWKDKSGNALILRMMVDKLDQGDLTIESNEFLQKQEQQENARRF